MHKGKVKNPCKICCCPVNNKNGLRCMGACKKWAHYKCLNYTPGKIHDIKAGLLKVNCPCPDCDYEPKEQYKKNFNLCGKDLCPAVIPPVCEIKNCPRNLMRGTTQTQKCPLGCEPLPAQEKQADRKHLSNTKIEKPSPILKSPPSPKKTSLSPTGSLKNSDSKLPTDGNNACCNKKCPSNSSKSSVSVRGSKSLCSTCPSNSSESSCCKKKEAMFSSNSDPLLPLNPDEARTALLNTIEQMCDAVGNFSRQFKNLMSEMMTALEHCQ